MTTQRQYLLQRIIDMLAFEGKPSLEDLREIQSATEDIMANVLGAEIDILKTIMAEGQGEVEEIRTDDQTEFGLSFLPKENVEFELFIDFVVTVKLDGRVLLEEGLSNEGDLH